jgi:hypothetical protein
MSQDLGYGCVNPGKVTNSSFFQFPREAVQSDQSLPGSIFIEEQKPTLVGFP